MTHIFARMKWDYSDEFDVHGLWVCTKEEWDEYLADWERSTSCGKLNECYFGTNEAITFESMSGFMSGVKVQSITKEEADKLIYHLGGDQLGFVPDPEWDEDDEDA